jgi:hypothetical protein
MTHISFTFCHNHKWWAFLSNIIQDVERTKFSHCAIFVSTETDIDIYDAEFPKVRQVTLGKFLSTYSVVESISLPEESEARLNEMVLWLKLRVGKWYSITQLFFILIYKLCPPLQLWLGHQNPNGNHKFICSELLGDFLHDFYNVSFDKDDDLIDLNDVLNKAKLLRAADDRNKVQV